MGQKMSKRSWINVNPPGTEFMDPDENPGRVSAKRLMRLVKRGYLAPLWNTEEIPNATDCECPICFHSFPTVNKTSCCRQDICTACFLRVIQPRAGQPFGAPCPFCTRARLHVQYSPATGVAAKRAADVIARRVSMECRITELLDPSPETVERREAEQEAARERVRSDRARANVDGAAAAIRTQLAADDAPRSPAPAELARSLACAAAPSSDGQTPPVQRVPGSALATTPPIDAPAPPAAVDAPASPVIEPALQRRVSPGRLSAVSWTDSEDEHPQGVQGGADAAERSRPSEPSRLSSSSPCPASTELPTAPSTTPPPAPAAEPGPRATPPATAAARALPKPPPNSIELVPGAAALARQPDGSVALIFAPRAGVTDAQKSELRRAVDAALRPLGVATYHARRAGSRASAGESPAGDRAAPGAAISAAEQASDAALVSAAERADRALRERLAQATRLGASLVREASSTARGREARDEDATPAPCGHQHQPRRPSSERSRRSSTPVRAAAPDEAAWTAAIERADAALRRAIENADAVLFA